MKKIDNTNIETLKNRRATGGIKWSLLAILFTVLIIIVGSAYFIRKFNISAQGAQGLKLGKIAYEKKSWTEAVVQLGKYTGRAEHTPELIPILMMYAEAQVNIRPVNSSALMFAVNTYRIVQQIEEKYNISDMNKSAATENLISLYLDTYNDYIEAETRAEKALSDSPSKSISLLYARALIGNKKHEKAFVVLEKLILDNPHYLEAYVVVAALSDVYSPAAQTDWFTKCIASNANMALPYVYRAMHNVEDLGVTDALVLGDIKKAESLPHSDVSILYEFAKLYIKINQLDKAKVVLDEIKTKDVQNLSLWVLYSRWAVKHGDKNIMANIADEGLATLKDNKWPFNLQAITLYLEASNSNKVELLLKEMEARKVSPLIVNYYRGTMLAQKGLYSESIKYLVQSLSPKVEDKYHHLRNTNINSKIATIHSLMGNNIEAMQVWRSVIASSPQLFQPRLAMAKLFVKLGNTQSALKHVFVALEINPKSIDAKILSLKLRAKILSDIDSDRSSNAWQKYNSDLSEFFTQSKTIAVSLFEIEMNFNETNIKKASHLVNQLYEKNIENIPVALTKAKIDFQIGNQDDSIKLYKNLLKGNARDLTALRGLALIYLLNKDITSIENIYFEAIKTTETGTKKRVLVLDLVEIYKRINQVDIAEQFLKQNMIENENDIFYKIRWGNHLLAKGETDLVDLVSDIKLLEGDGGRHWRLLKSKMLYFEDKFVENAVELEALLAGILSDFPGDLKAQLLLAQVYERTGKMQKAISEYESVWNQNPNDVVAIRLYLTALNKTNNVEKVRDILSLLSKKTLDLPAIKKLHVEHSLQLGDEDSALRILEQLNADFPEDNNTQIHLARLQIGWGSYDKARVLINKLLNKYPDNIQLQLMRITVDVSEKKFDDAIRYCSQLLTSREGVSIYLSRAHAYSQIQQYDLAYKDIDKAGQLEPENVSVWLLKAGVYKMQEKYVSANEAFLHALSIKPNSSHVLKETIVNLLDHDEIENNVKIAQELLARALLLAPDEFAFKYIKARLLLMQGGDEAYAQAVKHLESLLEGEHVPLDVYILLGQLYLDQKAHEKAEILVHKGLVFYPENKSLLFMKARSEYTRSPIFAIPTLKALLKDAPGDYRVVSSLVQAYIMNGDHEKTIKLIDKHLQYIKVPEDQVTLLSKQLISCESIGDVEAANKIFENIKKNYNIDKSLVFRVKCQLMIKREQWADLTELAMAFLHKNSSNALVLKKLGMMFLYSGSDETLPLADNFLSAASINENEDIELLRLLASLKTKRERYFEVIDVFQRLVLINDKDKESLNNLAWLTLTYKKDSNAALVVINKALQVDSEYGDALDTRGTIYFDLKMYEDAIKDYQKCFEIYKYDDPALAYIHFHMGKALMMVGKESQAINELNTALGKDRIDQVFTDKERLEIKTLLGK